jgi:hypothetical protein
MAIKTVNEDAHSVINNGDGYGYGYGYGDGYGDGNGW